jgi:recombination protein RecT
MSEAAAATVEPQENPVAILRHQLGNMTGEFQAALPAQIPVDRFTRVLLTAVQNNPELLYEVERRSLWNAAMRAAQDGLLPDGREGAIVVRRDRQRGKVANWQPMIAGIRKKARNSGEIATWDAHVVCAGDSFQFQLGDNPQVHHSYDLTTPRGEIIGAYSVCIMKDGTKSYEVMSIDEIHAVRDKTDAWKAFEAGKIKSTPWADYEGEMCRKTVARRHSKVLPMSTDLDDLIRRDDDRDDQAEERQELQARPPLRTITEKLDALTKAQDAVPDPADDWSQPVPDDLADEAEAVKAGIKSPNEARLRLNLDPVKGGDTAGNIAPEPPATFLPDEFEPIRDLARADAEKKIRRMAPTKLSDEEKQIYLQAFDAHRTAMAE